MRLLQKISWAIFGLMLFFLFWIGLLLAAQGKKFWMDESDGWFQTQYLSFGRMLLEGGASGASRSPLPYLFDKIIMLIWDNHPQSHWDMRLFTRIGPAFYWALSNTFLFFYLRSRMNRFLVGNSFVAFLIAITGTFFVFTNSFSAYYAIEARAYSLWTSLTLFQTCFLWSLMTEKKSKSLFFGFMISSYLLVFATYASSLQVGLACGFLLLNDALKEHRIKLWGDTQRWVLATLLGSAMITLFYYTKIEKMAYPPFPFYDYVMSVMEVILKSFRHHGPQPAWVTFPLLFLFIPFYWWRRNQSLALFSLNAHLSILLTYVHYRASLASGGLYASRYAAYLVPSLSFLYALGIFTVLFMLSQKIKKKWKKDFLAPMIIIYCLANIIPWVKTYTRGIPEDLRRFKARNSYMENLDPKCTGMLEHDPEPLEAQNDFCRKI